MLNQIKKSGLHTKTKVAQELVRELEMFLKSAGMKKQADLRLLSKRDDDLKKIFFYWASAALSEMTSETELQGMTIPPVGSDTGDIYGAKILNQLGGRMKRRRQASVAMYANFLNNLYEELKPLLISGINKAYTKFAYNNKEFERLNSDILEDLWQRATLWAVTGTRDSAIRDTEVSPWKRIEGNVEGGGSLAERVMKAIRKGVFSAMTSKGRYLSLDERRRLGLAKVDGEKIRQESIEGQSSSGEEYSKLDQFSAQGFIENMDGVGDTEKYIKKHKLTEEELETLTGLLTDGTYEDKPYQRALVLEILVRSGHILKDDAFIRTLKLDFMDGKFEGTEAMEKAVEVLELTGNPITKELVDLLQSYASGELDEDAFEDLEGNLIADGWLVDNIEIEIESEEAVKMINEKAEQMAEIAVQAINLPEGELGEAIGDLAKKELEVKELKKLLKLFTEDGFHWMLDANLYLDDAEWAKALRESNPKALKAIQEAIEEHQEPLLPLGLKNVLNSSVFEDKQKVIAIKEFVDQCMNSGAIKKMFGQSRGPLGWFIELAIVLNGKSITGRKNGSPFTLNIEKVRFFDLTQDFYAQLAEFVRVATDGEIDALVGKLDELVEPYRPKGLTYSVSDWLEKIVVTCKERKKSGNQAWKEARTSGIGTMKGFYSVVASDLVRYRFYLDIGLTEGDNLPEGLGNPDCDNRVLGLMRPIPTNAVNEVKSEGYDLMLRSWQAEVTQATQRRVDLRITEKAKLNQQVKKVFKEFGIEEGTELYEAFVNLG